MWPQVNNVLRLKYTDRMKGMSQEGVYVDKNILNSSDLLGEGLKNWVNIDCDNLSITTAIFTVTTK